MGVGQWFWATENRGNYARDCPPGPDPKDTLWVHVTGVQSPESERDIRSCSEPSPIAWRVDLGHQTEAGSCHGCSQLSDIRYTT